MEMNILFVAIAALVPLVMGFIWYGPLFGNAWMKEMGFTKESMEGKNMTLIFILCLVFSFILSFILQTLVIHQWGVYSSLMGEPGFAEGTAGEATTFFNNYMETYGDRFRTFKHGALHGSILGLFLVLPILAIIAMFEKKSVKYVAINAGYWIVSLAIMAGIVCQWV